MMMEKAAIGGDPFIGADSDGTFENRLEEAYAIIRSAFEKYPPEKGQIAISFNGGKDSVVAMELVIDVIGIDAVRNLCIFMFEEEGEYEELISYRNEYIAAKRLKFEVVPKSMSWQAGLAKLKSDHGLEGVVIGTRSYDPEGQRQKVAVSPTTGDFPPLIRYCPAFHWDYCHVWRYLNEVKKIPSCCLYAKGFTSLGSKHSTRPNPHLFDEATKTFRPAWELADGRLERAGRGGNPSL